MATALVTGGAGFIGSHVAANLLNEGHDVVVLDDLSGGSADYVPKGARIRRRLDPQRSPHRRALQ